MVSVAVWQQVRCDVCACVCVCLCCVSGSQRRISHHPGHTSDYLFIATSQIKLRQARERQRDAFRPSLSLAGLRITPPSAQQTLHALTTPTPPPSTTLSLPPNLPLPEHAVLILSFTEGYSHTLGTVTQYTYRRWLTNANALSIFAHLNGWHTATLKETAGFHLNVKVRVEVGLLTWLW